MIARRALATAALCAAACACASGSPERAAAPGARVVFETRAGAVHAVTVEVAHTEAERARGLMNRPSLAPDAGMLFVFEQAGPHAFWMKNTLIPLDMIFVGEDGRVTGVVARAVPGDLTARSAGGPSRYVVEVNGGWAEAHGVSPGDPVRFVGIGYP